MLTSAKIGKQNGDTRTRKPGYLNLSNRRPASLKKSDCRWHFLLQAGNLARSVNSISFIWNDNMREKREANANAT
jgi:hypothetical protein